MLGIRQVVEEGQHACDVQPPATALQYFQGVNGKTAEQRGKHPGNPEAAGGDIMRGAFCLEGLVGCVHGEEQQRQRYFGDQDIIGV